MGPIPTWNCVSVHPQNHHSPLLGPHWYPLLVLPITHSLLALCCQAVGGMWLLLTPGAGASPGVTQLTAQGPEHTSHLCWDLGLINLLSSREVEMVPEEAAR